METSAANQQLPLDKLTHTQFAQYLSKRPDRNYHYNSSGWYLQQKPISTYELRHHIFQGLITEYEDLQHKIDKPLLAADNLRRCKMVQFQSAVMAELREYCYVK